MQSFMLLLLGVLQSEGGVNSNNNKEIAARVTTFIYKIITIYISLYHGLQITTKH